MLPGEASVGSYHVSVVWFAAWSNAKGEREAYVSGNLSTVATRPSRDHLGTSEFTVIGHDKVQAPVTRSRDGEVHIELAKLDRSVKSTAQESRRIESDRRELKRILGKHARYPS